MRKTVATILLGLVGLTLSAQRTEEPSVALAKLWWPEQYNVWTPVGWPDHYFKFNVLYDGGIILSPATQAWRPHSQKWAGQDFQMMFCASADGHCWQMPAVPIALREWEGGLGVQNWDTGHDAPVLRTEFRTKDGVVLETAIFGHVTGGAPVQTALEPLYARVRVRVKHVDTYYHPQEFKMSVLLSRLFMAHVDYGKLAPDIGVFPQSAPGVGKLTMEQAGGRYRILNADGAVRVAAVPGADQKVELTELQEGLYNLVITFPSEPGSFVDLLVPMLAQQPDVFSHEESLSYEEALAQADNVWLARRPEDAAVFDVPEPFINEAVRANIDFTPILSEKDYETGEYCYITGTWGYDALWPTPGAFTGVMMDYLGYADEVARYDAVFAHTQGTATPPGPSYEQHSGYLAAPRHLQAIDWISDHGAILWQVATHGLLTMDEDFIAKWTDPLVKACEFIKDYSLGEHPGIPGLLPAGWSTDEEVPVQSVWNLAWNYKGLSTAVRLLEKTGHPRAAEFASFRDQFKETFLKEYRRVVEEGPRWVDDGGNVRYRPPQELYTADASRFQTQGRPVGHTFMTDAFYLDTGPMCLVWGGLMEPDDPIMQDVTAFFREGPNWELRKPFPWSCDRPVLEHEMSSCEPCYSYNCFHSWKAGDRDRFLEAMYSVLVGGISQNTFISCEHRHGMQAMQSAFALGFYLARLSVIDEQIVPGDLHLLRFCPLAWLRSDRPARFLRMPTEFGPVDLTAQLSKDGKTLEVSLKGDWRERPGEVVLHVPPVPGLRKVSVNGRRYPASRETIELKP